MNAIISTTSRELIVPVPRTGPITTRAATMNDMVFIDSLQKLHSKALGFFPRAQMQGYIENGWVLIAEDAATQKPVGYCASRDRYLKRDELGVIYQLCVMPGHQRGLIGASLIKEVFQRSAYGCRLYCCWCAQDLAANHFWESLGFVPIAFRAGSTGKKRVHIFWQRRIDEERENVDCGTLNVEATRHLRDAQHSTFHNQQSTPYWYPFKTDQGAMREDRIVFPIPPGVHWTDVKAVAVPAATLPAALDCAGTAERAMSKTKPKPPLAAKPANVPLGGFCFQPERPAKQPKPKAKDAKTPAARIDPTFLKKARELRDRYLEHLASGALRVEAQGKYLVSRDERTNRLPQEPTPLLMAG